MTNIDRATDIIEGIIDETHLYPDGGLPAAAAKALADAGLLMPDLPEPDNGYPEWLVDGISISPGLNAGEVDIEWEGPMLRLAPDKVLAFLAAATYAERHHHE